MISWRKNWYSMATLILLGLLVVIVLPMGYFYTHNDVDVKGAFFVSVMAIAVWAFLVTIMWDHKYRILRGRVHQLENVFALASFTVTQEVADAVLADRAQRFHRAVDKRINYERRITLGEKPSKMKRTALLEGIKYRKSNFWNMHAAAKMLILKVKESSKDYLPPKEKSRRRKKKAV